MGNELRFDGKVAIVTGAGQGLGRTHAELLASRGARVVVNDLGGSATGGGESTKVADEVVASIRGAGGEAVASYDSVTDGEKIVQTALDTWGRLDIVVNNAGILRDTTFHKLTQEDWDLIYRVHVLGSFKVTHAAWPHLREQQYGRVVFTSSAAGIYGNFGQANYAMAKLGLVGLSNTLGLEGRKRNILVNTVAPIAGSRLTETVLPKEITEALKPEVVSPLVAWLCHEDCDSTGGLFEVGGGFFAKLRWERAEGKTWRTGRPISPEDIRASWDVITDFSKSDHPADIGQSMQPIMGNIQAGPSRGGNELIDVDAALGWEFPDWKSSYGERDLALYALGVGAASDPRDPAELQLVYEMSADGFKAVPTFGVIPAVNGMLDFAKKGTTAPGMNYGLDRILHGEQYTELVRPLPPNARLTHRARIKDIFDKGKGALVVTETKSFDEDGDLLIVNESSIFVRGAGGWGGDRGPSSDLNTPPDRAPDAIVEEKVDEGQALLYRLSGDWNPLHVDPSFASAFGFERPILHGLCTYGFACRHVVKAMSGGDPRYFKSIKVRFADPVIPGETLVTEMWRESDTRVVFRCKAKERDQVVISNAAVELYSEIPKKAPKRAAVTAPAAAGPAVATSADIFHAIGQYLEQSPDLVGRVKTVFQFKLSNPEAIWTLDAKNGPGAVTRGANAKPDTTLEIGDADFMDMCTGKANAQKLYFGGQLKISGDVMASQKLDFLKKVEPAMVQKAMEERLGGAAAATGDAGTGGEMAQEPASADVFLGMQVYVERHPELAEKVQSVFLFKLTEPDSAWTLDLKSGKGAVFEGDVEKPDCTLTLSEPDFMAMTKGEANPQKLYFSGKLKISGNVMASQKLDFLQKIQPAEVAEEIAKRKAAGAGKQAAAAPAAPAREPVASVLFQKIKSRVAENPALAGDVQALLQFNLSSPQGRWVVDLSKAPGEVREGTADSPTAAFTLEDEDLEALAKGGETAQSLHQRGRLRVDGDIRVAHRLGFLKQLA